MKRINVEEVPKKVGEYVKRGEDVENDRRKNNLIIFGVRESEKGDTEAKYEDDKMECRKIFEEIRVNDCRMEQLIRLGKKRDDGKARPLLARLGSEGEKWAVLSRAKNLRNFGEPMSKVFVNRDMSREEREKDYRLRVTVEEKRRSEEVGWKIKRGTLVREVRESVLEPRVDRVEAREESREVRRGAIPKIRKFRRGEGVDSEAGDGRN